MKIPSGAKPWLSVAKDVGRYAINELNLRVTGDGKGALEATDGRHLVSVDVTLDEGDTAGLVPVGVVKAAITDRGTTDRTVRANGHAEAMTKAGLVTVARPEGEFPDTLSVTPPKPTPGLTLTINADYLKRIQDALGAQAVTIHFEPVTDGTAWKAIEDGTSYQHEYRHGMLVLPCTFDGNTSCEGYGVLMPIRSQV